MLNRDPAITRPAMVPGGVTATTAPVAIQQMAARIAGHGLAATSATVYQAFNILEQVAGRIWGVMNVRYADGREIPRRLNGDRAYRARVRFADGHEEVLYMLQACGNDLRVGGISRYLPGPEFRFEADPAVVTPAPVPQPVVQPAPAATPMPTPTPQPTEPTPAGPTNEGGLMFEMKCSADGRPNMIRFDSSQVDEFFFGRDGKVTLRYREVETEEEVEEVVNS